MLAYYHLAIITYININKIIIIIVILWGKGGRERFKHTGILPCYSHLERVNKGENFYNYLFFWGGRGGEGGCTAEPGQE